MSFSQKDANQADIDLIYKRKDSTTPNGSLNDGNNRRSSMEHIWGRAMTFDVRKEMWKSLFVKRLKTWQAMVAH